MENIKEITFQEYQQKVLDLYEEVYLMLESLSIKWWVHSGALIGIKRHNDNLIPWDDDIDIMVTSKQWVENLPKIQQFVDEKNYTLFDFKHINTNVRSHIKFAKIVSDETYFVTNGEEKSDGESRPFIDIFFACPSEVYSEKGWKKYQKIARTEWIASKGFNRFFQKGNNAFLTFVVNLFSYPIKIFMSHKRMEKYLDKPFESNGNWDIVKRADVWSARNIEYDLIDGLIEGKLGDKKAIYTKNWDDALRRSYGNDWMVEKKSNSHLMGQPNLEQSIFVKDFLRNKYK